MTTMLPIYVILPQKCFYVPDEAVSPGLVINTRVAYKQWPAYIAVPCLHMLSTHKTLKEVLLL